MAFQTNLLTESVPYAAYPPFPLAQGEASKPVPGTHRLDTRSHVSQISSHPSVAPNFSKKASPQLNPRASPVL